MVGFDPGEEKSGAFAGDDHFFVVGHFANDVALVADFHDGDLIQMDVAFLVLAETLLGCGFHIHEFCLERSEFVLL